MCSSEWQLALHNALQLPRHIRLTLVQLVPCLQPVVDSSSDSQSTGACCVGWMFYGR